ncbi:MAG: dihydrolipoamide acetyltransferase family protein [Planctomycetota bacterium]
MPAQITMPQQSDTMTEGTLVKWNVAEGDTYNEGDIVAEIETDKATMEMEGPDSDGTIAALLVQEGEAANVGAVLAVVALEGEDVAEVKANAGSGKAASAAAPAEAQHTAEAQVDESAETKAAVVATQALPTNGSANGAPTGRIKASPLARRIAEQKGVDIAALHGNGSGPGGRIVQKDVLDFIDSGKATPAAGASTTDDKLKVAQPVAVLPDRVASGQVEEVALTKMRKTIAARLQQSKQTIPHFYESMDIDMEAANAARAALNKMLEPEGIRLSIGDVIAKAVACALKAHPGLNAHFTGDAIKKFGDVHLGMAVALDDGLIVPVLKNIDQMGLKEIRLRSKDLIDKARKQKLKGDEMTGATFTVSNLGTMGIKEFMAIVNPPEVGILAIGGATKRVVVNEAGDFEARSIMTVTLSADHRAVDGADAAKFLGTLRDMLQQPAGMLV